MRDSSSKQVRGRQAGLPRNHVDQRKARIWLENRTTVNARPAFACLAIKRLAWREKPVAWGQGGQEWFGSRVE